jgi:hypothetical protein
MMGSITRLYIRNSESQPSETQCIHQISFEEGALADVAPHHLLRFVPRVLHDVALVGPGRRGGGRESGAQRVSAEFLRSESQVSNTSLQNQSHAAIAETRVFDHAVLADFAEDRTMLDLCPSESGLEDGHRAGRRFRPFGIAISVPCPS